MRVQSVRIPDEMADRLDALAKETKRPKASFIREALTRYLEELEDREIALSRLRDPDAEWVDHEEVKRRVGLD